MTTKDLERKISVRQGKEAATSVPEVVGAQQDERRRREAIVTELTSIFHMLDRFIMLMRVYPTGHPLIDHFADQAHERMRELAERMGYIFFKLDATELTTEWDSVFFSQELSEQGWRLESERLEALAKKRAW